MGQAAIIVIGVIVALILIAILIIEILRWLGIPKPPAETNGESEPSSGPDPRSNTEPPPKTSSRPDPRPNTRPSTEPSRPESKPNTVTGTEPVSESAGMSDSLNMSHTSVIDNDRQRVIKSGEIISVATNGPTMFYLHRNQTIEAIGNGIPTRVFQTNLTAATQIHVFDQIMYAVDGGMLLMAGTPTNDIIKFVPVPIFASLDDVQRITSRADRFAIVRGNGQVYIYQHRPEFKLLQAIDGIDFFFGYEPDTFAILDENHTLHMNGPSISGGSSVIDRDNVLTMAYQRDNTPVIIEQSRRNVISIESYFGNIYLLIRRN